MKSVILDFEFKNDIEELIRIAVEYPKLGIILKGTGVISNGKLNK